MPRRYCLTLDLKDDPALIAEYRRHHEAVWPEVLESLRASGIEQAEIYLHGTRMMMVLDVAPVYGALVEAFDRAGVPAAGLARLRTALAR